MPHLEDWSLTHGPVSAYMAPEQITHHLRGIVTGHPRKQDGDMVMTTRVESIDYARRTARTKNTDYTLGEPDWEWLKWCDDNEIDRAHVVLSVKYPPK